MQSGHKFVFAIVVAAVLIIGGYISGSMVFMYLGVGMILALNIVDVKVYD